MTDKRSMPSFSVGMVTLAELKKNPPPELVLAGLTPVQLWGFCNALHFFEKCHSPGLIFWCRVTQ